MPRGLGTLGPEDGVGGLDTVLGLVAPVIIEGKEYRARNAVSYVYRNIASSKSDICRGPGHSTWISRSCYN